LLPTIITGPGGLTAGDQPFSHSCWNRPFVLAVVLSVHPAPQTPPWVMPITDCSRRRVFSIDEPSVTFWTRDKKEGDRRDVQCSLKEFVDRWAQHILERYQHAVRSFGLFAPRALARTSGLVFASLGQKRRACPKCLPWAISIQRDFGWDTLLDDKGKRMKWVRRLAPRASSSS
jgi:hypothetical protein